MTDLVDRLREAYSDSSNLTFKLAADEIERQQQVIANMMIDAHVSADEIERLRKGWLDQAARDAAEIVRLEVEIDRLRAIVGGFLDCPEIADCAPEDKDPETYDLERRARAALGEAKDE